ncbi:MAG: aspartate aminotransferase family protein [Candidatus Solibacter sp.]
MAIHDTAAPPLDGLYSDHVNPQWVKLLNVLQMNVTYDRCTGSELFTSDGRRILDFLSGYCVHNVGHNHPAIIAALKEELDRSGPAMLQSHVSHIAAQLAERLVKLAGGQLERVYFTNSGSEGIETAIKFARAHTRRSRLLYANGGFHGLTCGALSLMSDRFWSEGFGPMLPGTQGVPFGDLEELEEALATRKFAAFILEPVQSEGGIQVPEGAYLQQAQALCRRYGTLFVLDEVQTGMFRTGTFLAAHRFQLEPDMVILAKALSGGLVPVGAVLMTQAIGDSVFTSLKRSIVHASTFGENSLAMRAGLATLDVLEAEALGERASRMGARLRHELAEALAPYEMVNAVRGLGMLGGIEFAAPRQLRLRIAFEACRRIHPALLGQIVVMRLFRDHGILTQICGNNFMVLKVAPPLMVTERQCQEFVEAAQSVSDLMHHSTSFWNESLGMARRVVNL